MRPDFIANTNILIYIHEGNQNILPFLDFAFGISFITEIELLGFKGIREEEEIKLRKLIGDCYFIDWNLQIKEKTIALKKEYNIKLPDAIIAATSIVNEIPLLTADKDFSRIEKLDLIMFNF